MLTKYLSGSHNILSILQSPFLKELMFCVKRRVNPDPLEVLCESLENVQRQMRVDLLALNTPVEVVH